MSNTKTSQFYSTRDASASPKMRSFKEAVLEGLAEDGGLLIPAELPIFSVEEILDCKTYVETAKTVIKPFVGDCLVWSDMEAVIEKAYAYSPENFTVPDVVVVNPVKTKSNKTEPIKDGPLNGLSVAESTQYLELFHGPTNAFKDVALQLLGGVFGLLQKVDGAKKKITVLGATSGDTGSAAMAGLSRCDNVNCLILYPLGGTSDVQEAQMLDLSNKNSNIEGVSVKGSTFDDCQNMVKELFMSSKGVYNLVAVNSINWCRIMAQMVYYWYAASRYFSKNSKLQNVVVPTGNFGNILAAYYAKKTGAPIGDLIIASNTNDILTRCYNTGEMNLTPVSRTYSPSMDIQISSNFERFLRVVFACAKLTGEKCAELKSGGFKLTEEQTKLYQSEFKAYRASEEETIAAMKEVKALCDYELCPHTAVGVVACLKYMQEYPDNDTPMVAATAHYSKFPDAATVAFPGEAIKYTPGLSASIANAPLSGRQVIECGAGHVEAKLKEMQKK